MAKKTIKTVKSLKNRNTASKSKAPSKKAATKTLKTTSKKVSYMAKGFTTLTPAFAVPNAGKAIEWLTNTFGMKVKDIYKTPAGGVAHAELRIGDSIVMCGDMQEETYNVRAQIYVKNADEVFNKALAAGATQTRPLTTQFYGDRSGTVRDPFGNEWTLATHVEDVSKKEMDKRMAAMAQQA